MHSNSKPSLPPSSLPLNAYQREKQFCSKAWAFSLDCLFELIIWLRVTMQIVHTYTLMYAQTHHGFGLLAVDS